MSTIHHLLTLASHKTFTQTAISKNLPSIIYVCNPSLPACKIFTPQYETLASHYNNEYEIMFAQMDYGPETSMLFKFAPNQLPVLTLMCEESEERGGGMWAKTVMGVDLKELRAAVEEMIEMAGR